MERLKVADLNVWNKSGPWSERLALIRAELAATAPDIVGLQEVLRVDVDPSKEHTPDTDQATEIAQGLGYSVAFAAATTWGNGVLFGNAVLSRFPIVESAGFRLPGAESGETRCLLYASLATPIGVVPVFVTHLNWKLHHGMFRLPQARYIDERIAEIVPQSRQTFPPILMGDFNAHPTTDEIRYLTGELVHEGKSVYWADAWTFGGDGPGYTFDRVRNGFAALCHEPPRRIDYIFVRGPDSELRGEPLTTRLAFHQGAPGANGTVWPSDHFGLYTELAAQPRKP